MLYKWRDFRSEIRDLLRGNHWKRWDERKQETGTPESQCSKSWEMIFNFLSFFYPHLRTCSLILERGGVGRDSGRETSMWERNRSVNSVCTLTRTEPATQESALTRNWTGNLSLRWMMSNWVTLARSLIFSRHVYCMVFQDSLEALSPQVCSLLTFNLMGVSRNYINN